VLLADTWALVRAGERSVADMLALAAGLGTEVEPSCWDAVDRTLDFLDRAIGDDGELRALLAARTRSLLSPTFERLGWERAEGEDVRAQVLRATLLRRLGTTGEDEGIRAEAAARFDAGVVEGDLANAIVGVVNSMRRAGDFDEMRRRFREAKDPQTEERYRQGLAGVADAELCVRLYDTCFDEFRMQDAPIVIARLTMNPVGGRVVWEAVASGWDGLLERVPPPLHFALGLGLILQVTDAEFAARAVAFHRSHPLASGQQRVEQALENLTASARLAARERPTLAATLR
jgi:puromycin-sensitive aminopeptidase